MNSRGSGIQHLAPVVRGGKPQPLSSAVAWERLVFVSGQVPPSAGGAVPPDIATQTHAAIDAVEAILRDAGCTLADVVKTTVWLTDASDYPGFNAAYAERFPHGAAPARSTVVAGLIAPARVEIEVVAVRPPAS